MIANISLANFRGFETKVSVRIRPITVLIGRNSAGKSTVMKFLLMLRQTLESQREEFFVTDGRYVQMGNWPSLRNSRSPSKAFVFEIELATSDIPPVVVQQLWSAMRRKGVVTETGEQVRFTMDISRSSVSQESPKGLFTVNGRILYTKQFKYGRHEVRGRILEREIFAANATNLRSTSFLRFRRTTDSLNKLFQSVAAEQFLDRLRYEFTSIRHLSPIREESLRSIQIANPPPGDVGDRGEYAIPHLVRLFSDPMLANEADLIARAASRVADVDAIRIQSRIASLYSQVKAKNTRTGAINYLADFGFGVGQCIPIFVQGALQVPHQLLMVEQPESQLHPTAQLELGTFFAELWTERQVPTIIETHSANVLLRLRRLVKEGQLKPDDLTVAFFTVERRKVVVKNLDVQADGSLEKGLPMEFFGADVIEAIDMGS